MKISLNKKVSLIILISFILSLLGVYTLATNCGGTTLDCLLNNEKYFNDFTHQFNIIKYMAVHHSIPYEVVYFEDGSYDGVSSGGYKLPFWRAPFYYMLGAFVYSLSKKVDLLPLLSLHVLSTIIVLITNILFFLFVKKISKFINVNKEKFVLYSVVLFVFLPPHLYISLGVQDDSLFYLFFIASLYAYITLLESKTNKKAALLGLFIGLSLLSRLTGIVLLAPLILILVYYALKKNYRVVKLYAISLFTSLIISGYFFIRNQILFGNIMGGILEDRPQKDFGIFIRNYRGFWGGIEGGNNNIYFLLVFICLALTFLTIYGLFVYRQEMNKNINLKFLIILFFVIILFALNWTCNVSIFLTNFKCIGYEVQSRFVITLVPLIALFSSFSLINLEKKRKHLHKIIPLFVILAAILFAIDFVTALSQL